MTLAYTFATLEGVIDTEYVPADEAEINAFLVKLAGSAATDATLTGAFRYLLTLDLTNVGMPGSDDDRRDLTLPGDSRDDRNALIENGLT